MYFRGSFPAVPLKNQVVYETWEAEVGYLVCSFTHRQGNIVFTSTAVSRKKIVR